MNKSLSIFCDESGDFGAASKHSPYYLLGLVFHNQNASISEALLHYKSNLSLLGCAKNVIHSYSLIRKEPPYQLMNLQERQKLFNVLVSFMRHCNISIHTIHVDKTNIGNQALSAVLSKSLTEYLFQIKDLIGQYEKIIIYYDKGQKQITRILFDVFTRFIDNVEFRKIYPEDYYLFQVADMVCTLSLLKIKYPNLNNSEKRFFKSLKRLKKNYLSVLKKKELQTNKKKQI